MSNYSKLLKELEVQKEVLDLERSQRMSVGYRQIPLQVPTYVCFNSGSTICHAGKNAIQRYKDATGLEVQNLYAAIEVPHVDLVGTKILSRKMALVPFQIPNCSEHLIVPFCILETKHTEDFPLRFGMDFCGLLENFLKENEVECLPEDCLLKMQAGIELAWRKVDVPKCGMCFDMDPYPRDSVYSKVFQKRLLEPLSTADITSYLENGIVFVEFLKSHSTSRKMYCTKANLFIPRTSQPKGSNPNRFDEQAIRVFDLDESEWRSFKKENLLKLRIKRNPYTFGPDMLQVVARKCSN